LGGFPQILSQPGLWPGVWGRRADQKGEEKLQGVPRAADVFFLLLSLGFRMEDGDELYGYLISMFFCCWALELIVAEIVAAIIN